MVNDASRGKGAVAREIKQRLASNRVRISPSCTIVGTSLGSSFLLRSDLFVPRRTAEISNVGESVTMTSTA